MPANFDLKRLAGQLGDLKAVKKDPRILVRLLLGLLLAANIVAAFVLFKPWAASAEELERQLGQLRQQVQQKKASIDRLRVLAKKVEQARQEGNEFMKEYFMDRRVASSTIVSELKQTAESAGIKQKEHSFVIEPIEGSDTVSMMSISGNYEGTYDNLVRFINGMDRSPRFLILESLQAVPQKNAAALSVTLKLIAFVQAGQPLEAAVAVPPGTAGKAGT
jgi:type IV pilus assembly protein PilO